MKLIKLLLTIFILSSSYYNFAKSDDIKDFQIEGISIGDSLLNYFDKDLIYKNDKYVQIGAGNNKNLKLNIDSKTYDNLSIILKTVDNTYKVYSLGGRIFCEDINVCKLKKKQIVSDLKIFFGDDVTVEDVVKNHNADPTGNSKSFSTFFIFESSNDYVEVYIYDWSKNM